MGSISIIYSYKNRNILKKYTKNDPIINLFFWITSFNSTKCIRNFMSRKNTKESYCNKYSLLKKFCRNPNEYQIRGTYYDHLRINEDITYKFITNFKDAIERIKKEDEALKIINIYNQTNYFQRYNETFTYFFPWDLEGIEIGTRSVEEIQQILKELTSHKKMTIENLYIIYNDPNKILIINDIMYNILNDNLSNIKNSIDNSAYTTTHFLLSKFLLLYKCDIVNNIYKLNNTHNMKTNINNLILEIIDILVQPLEIYEYVLQEDDTFEMICTGFYTIEDELINTNLIRKSNFCLFEQKSNKKTKITEVFKSDKQLNNSRKQ